MSLIDRASTFRGKVVDHAVTVTKNEWPQVVCSLAAVEIWDEEDQVWVNLADVELDANEITAYVVLYGKDGETLSFNQVKKVFNWNGASFKELDDIDSSEIGIQFRVAYGTGDYASKLKVEWIDEYDAEPGRSVRKLDPTELKQLDAKYAKYLKAGTGKAAPVKASGGKAGTVKAKGVKPTSPKGPVKKTTKPKSNTPPDEAPETDESKKDLPSPVGSCTKQEAWDEVVELKDKKITDEQVAKAWGNAIKEIGGGKAVDKFTDENWFQVKITVLGEVVEIPF